MAREISFTERGGTGVFIEHIRERFGRTPELAVLVAFIAVLIFFTIATNGQILTPDSLSSIMTNAASQGVLAVGITMLMISGEFDLSVGSILGLTALIFILAADSGLAGLAGMVLSDTQIHNLGISSEGFSGIVSILVALAAGGLLGLVNGLILISTRIPSFIVTLGTLYLYRSIMLNIIPGGTIARYLREPMYGQFTPVGLIVMTLVLIAFFAWMIWKPVRTSWRQFQEDSGNGRLAPISRLVFLIGLLAIGGLLLIAIITTYGISSSELIEIEFFKILNGRLTFLAGNFRSAILWWFIIAAIFQIILTQSPYGNAVYATGGNPGAARAQGIHTNRIKVTNFVLSGVLAAVGGILEAGRFEVVEPLRGTGYELDVIAAAVIGGTLLTGGYGNIIGAVLGVLLAFMLRTGLVLMGVEATWFRGVLGVIMIVAVIINTNIRRQR